MENLTGPEVTLLVAVIGFAGGLLGWFGRGIAFVLRRWWTKAPKKEDAIYLNSVADLAAKLRANGMTMEDVRGFEVMMRGSTAASSEAAKKVVEELVDRPSEPEAYHNNVAMKARTGAAYQVAEASLEQALLDLQLLMNEYENEALVSAQDRWREYRTALENCALREYEGGSHAPLAMILVGLAETERRAEEIRAQVVERSGR